MKLYELTVNFDRYPSHEEYFSSRDAADTEIRRLKKEAESSGLSSLTLYSFVLANISQKQIILGCLNKKGFVQAGSRKELVEWNSWDNKEDDDK